MQGRSFHVVSGSECRPGAYARSRLSVLSSLQLFQRFLESAVGLQIAISLRRARVTLMHLLNIPCGHDLLAWLFSASARVWNHSATCMKCDSTSRVARQRNYASRTLRAVVVSRPCHASRNIPHRTSSKPSSLAVLAMLHGVSGRINTCKAADGL